MSILCLWSPVWQTGEGLSAELTDWLLEEAPRVVVEGRGVVWVDVRGLPGERIARRLLERLAEGGVERIRGGIAAVPVVAEVAARTGSGAPEVVGRGAERGYLAPHPLGVLTEDWPLLTLLEGAGVHRCEELARLTAEEVEVRFGPDGIRLWRRARGEDSRPLFRPIPPERPHASLDFVDHTVRDATRLVFTLNALLDQVCGELRFRARRARAMVLTFHLSGGGASREVLRTARPTGERAIWIRRLREFLERVRLPDAVSGVALEVGALEPVSSLQGDLFDRGFATAGFVEEAVARLMDSYAGLFVRQTASRHPLAERRVQWVEVSPEEVAEGRIGIEEREAPGPVERRGTSARGSRPVPVGSEPPLAARVEDGVKAGGQPVPVLELQLLSEPRPIAVRTRTRRDHLVPVAYREGKAWHDLTAAGPDRVSGGHEEERPYAREYYRCVAHGGALIWIYRDAFEGGWYLHGWWD